MAAKRVRKIGILGGTFNPIHVGHLLIAQDALERVGLDEVRFIPTATPPHKAAAELASGVDRRRMIALAIRDEPRFVLDDIEMRRGGPSYSVDTLTELRRREPAARYFFIIGSDSLAELHLWREISRLARLCTFLALTRPGVPVKPPRRGLGIRYRAVAGHVCDVSSSEVRRRVKTGKSIRYLVPQPVVRYIERRKLYQSK